MAGWRIGFAVGNPTLIGALARVKSYLDYGAFTPIQAAATAALNGPQDIVAANRALYKKRRDVMVECFGRAGWDIPVPMASMFAWAPIPEAYRHLGSMEFAKQLLTHAHVAVAPGVGFGEEGEGFVRLALVENEQRLRQAARGIKAMLGARLTPRRDSPFSWSRARVSAKLVPWTLNRPSPRTRRGPAWSPPRGSRSSCSASARHRCRSSTAWRAIGWSAACCWRRGWSRCSPPRCATRPGSSRCSPGR